LDKSDTPESLSLPNLTFDALNPTNIDAFCADFLLPGPKVIVGLVLRNKPGKELFISFLRFVT
jgi:hypothetical protein